MFLFGANLPETFYVTKALTRVFGVGAFKSTRICNQVGVFPKQKVQELTERQISNIAELIENDPDKCGYELQRKIGQRITKLHSIKSVRGDRLARGLPVNGQKSHKSNTAKRRHGQFQKIQPIDFRY